MTPKEKAIELVEKYREIDDCTEHYDMAYDGSICCHLAIKCALIAVELRLDGHFAFSDIEFGEDSMDFWEQVRDELKKDV